MKTFKRMMAVFLVNVALLLAGIVIIELLFGSWLVPNNLNRLNLLRDVTYEVDISELYQWDSPTITYSRDKHGLRGPYGGDPRSIGLLTVGGSTTDQRTIADGLTWQDILQHQFDSIGIPIKVANAGVDGQTTFGHIKNFDWWFPYVPDLRPQYILFYVGLNDVWIERDNSSYDLLLSPLSPRPFSLVASLKENSALWHLARTIKGVHSAIKAKLGHQRLDFSTAQWTTRPLHKSYEFVKPRLDGYAERLSILADRTRGLGAQPIFVTQPCRLYRLTKHGLEGWGEFNTYEGRRINGVDYYNISARFDSVMEAVSVAKKALFINLGTEPEWEDEDFYDTGHMTPQGARKVGLYLSTRLRQAIGGNHPTAP